MISDTSAHYKTVPYRTFGPELSTSPRLKIVISLCPVITFATLSFKPERRVLGNALVPYQVGSEEAPTTFTS